MPSSRLTVDVHLAPGDLAAQLRREAAAGLRATPKWLAPKWHYDARGSHLFDEITRLPEYYLTRAERALLAEHADELAARSRADTLVELGAGTADKTRLLLDALQRAGTLRRYAPLDVDEATLREAAARVLADYPGIEVHAVVADFTHHLDEIPAGERRLVAFLGSTLGNLVDDERARFLRALAGVLRARDSVLLGLDLVKDPARLEAAYNDARGVTASFNRNILRVLDDLLDADFDPDRFAHVSFYDADRERIDTRLRSLTDQEVHVRALDLVVRFAEGEDLLTETSGKFRREGFERELRAAGLEPRGWWQDAAGDFALALAAPGDA